MYNTGNSVSVLLSNKDGTLAPAVNCAVNPPSPSPSSYAGPLAAADINGDGRPDLVVATAGGANNSGFAVLLDNGDGTFAATLHLDPDLYVGRIAAGDFNGDGKADLGLTIPTGVNDWGVDILLGTGNGNFGAPIALDVAVGSFGPDITLDARDCNGDGRQDLLVKAFGSLGRAGSSTWVQVALGNGDGTFDTAGQPTISDAGVVAVGDFNADGRPDLVVGTGTQGAPSTTLNVLLNAPNAQACSPGVFDPGSGTWYLRSQYSAGAPDAGQFAYGLPNWEPVVGDWDGNGTTTVGVVDPSTATWYRRDSNSPGAADVTPFQYGLPGWIPVTGDWTGSGHCGIGMFDPSTGTWYLRNEDSPGPPDAGVLAYGLPGWIPVVGDWDGDGTTTIGVVDPVSMTWYLRDSNSAGAPDIAPFQYGAPGWRPVAGDWTGIGRGGIGVIDPSGVWYLRDSNSAGAPDVAPFAYGLGGWTPLAGTWRPAASPAAAHSARAAQAVDPLSAEALGLGADLGPLAGTGPARHTGALDQLFGSF